MYVCVLTCLILCNYYVGADLLNKVEKKRVRREEPERCDCKEKRAKPNQV